MAEAPRSPPPPAAYPPPPGGYNHRPEAGGADPGAGGFLQRAMTTMDFGKGAIAFSCATGVAIYDAVDPARYKPEPGLVVATLFVIFNLTIGVYVSSVGRRHRIMAFLNFCACFIPLIIAMAHGGEFKPELVKQIYDTLV